MSVLEQGFGATFSWVTGEYITKGLKEEESFAFLWMEDLEISGLPWACLGLFCGVPMMLLQFMYSIIAKVLYNY